MAALHKLQEYGYIDLERLNKRRIMIVPVAKE